MDVSVFGIGYVGLVQAAALADVGHRVLCVDLEGSCRDKGKLGHSGSILLI